MRNLSLSLLSLGLLLLTAIPAAAEMLRSDLVPNDYSTARLIADRQAYTPGDPFWVALHLELKDGWHTYWKNPGDSGYETRVTLTLPDGFTASDIHWPVPIRYEMAGIVNYGYKDEAWHYVQITPPADARYNLPITAEAEWLVCEEICVPESATLTLDLPSALIPASASAAFHQGLATVPEASTMTLPFKQAGDQVYVRLPDNMQAQEVQLFPLDNNRVSNATLPAAMEADGAQWLVFAEGTLVAQTSWRAVLQDDSSGSAKDVALIYDTTLSLPMTPALAASADAFLSLPLALLFAFIGGVILNLMPCVLPVLSLKVLGLVKHAGDDPTTIRRHGLAYTCGVLLSFAAIAGILMVLQYGGAQIGWGFQLQSPLFVAGLALVMLAVGLNLSGVYELPSRCGNLGHGVASQSSPSGSFFTGMLAVLVATPCTAPLMAPALGFALTQPPLLSLLIFVVLGLGLAAPFLLVSLWPKLAEFLPKPGAWMLRFKQFLAFPMYATAAWLLWVLTRQEGTEALAIMFALGLGVALLLWGIGVTASTMRKRLLLIVLALGVVSGLDSLSRLQAVTLLDTHTRVYAPETLEELRANQVPVFVYATADWCITCKVNERIALYTETVAAHFEQTGMAVLKADWTDYDDTITAFLKRHDRAGVPLYVYYPPGGDPQLLPQLLTPSLVVDATTL